MHKQELRLKFRKKRNLLSSPSVENYSLQIANTVLGIPIWDSSFFHVFLSITKKNEIKTEPLLSIIQGKDKHVVIPKTFPNGVLKNYLLTDGVCIKENALGIPEPEDGIEISEKQLDVVFVPMLAFDQKGHRVGYGGGYYDRLLKKCKPEIIKIGLSFFEAVDQIEDIDENDVPMDFCVTPNKIYEF